MANEKLHKVLVNGPGTIGLPVLQTLLKFRKVIGIEDVYFHKFSPNQESTGMLVRLIEAGAKLVVEEEKKEEFYRILKPEGEQFLPSAFLKDVLGSMDAVIDCTADGIGLQNKTLYEAYPNLSVVIAQGSETDFGFPYAYGHNDDALRGYDGKMVWVMSCNVHAILATIHALSRGYSKPFLENIERIRFFLDRRGADPVNLKTVTTSEIGDAGEYNDFYGSHQTEDAAKLLRTLGTYRLDLYGVADKEPQPFMHKSFVHVDLKRPVTREKIIELFQECMFTGVTNQCYIGKVYTEGKDWGLTGRINLQCVLVIPSITVIRGGREIIFRYLTPQDGNPIASSLASLLRYFRPDSWRELMKKHYHPLFKKFKVV